MTFLSTQCIQLFLTAAENMHPLKSLSWIFFCLSSDRSTQKFIIEDLFYTFLELYRNACEYKAIISTNIFLEISLSFGKGGWLGGGVSGAFVCH